MAQASDFRPPLWLRSGMVQTVLASSKRRQARFSAFEAAGQRVELNAGPGRRSTAYLNLHRDQRGLVVLLHGWLGGPGSGYVLSTAQSLHEAGLSVARVTLPDQGEAALLTREVIDLTRHDVLRTALLDLLGQLEDQPVGLMGFSLGGNFAFRLARDHAQHPIPNLRHVIGASAVIEPEDTCTQIDAIGLFRRYFLKKFLRLSQEKQAVFPDLPGVSDLLGQRTIRAVTEISVRHYTRFLSLEAYFEGYRIGRCDLAGAAVPVTLLTALDDPIVRPQYAQGLTDGPGFERIFTRHGGHNGFYTRFPAQVFSDHLAVDRFTRDLR